MHHGAAGPSCHYRITAASYLLGALNKREHDEFRRHASWCPSCDQEMTELLPVVVLLTEAKWRT